MPVFRLPGPKQERRRMNEAEASRLRREIQTERSGRLLAMQRIAGLQSANQRLKVALLGARAEIERLKLQHGGDRFVGLDLSKCEPEEQPPAG
jgi:hypothetical protein